MKLILDGGEKYLEHRSYVANCSTIFPLMKDGYEGKYIELDFSQNLALRPKHVVQSAHFSGKQFSLHCAITEPFEKRYFYHLSDDTKHDGIFVDLVIRNIIQRYAIKYEDLWIQSDNASSQYKNKLPFALYQQLPNEFNLRIIRTYGAAGHGKGVIDAMSSFGVKNVLRHDIVTQDVFFNTSEEIYDYLTIKNTNYYYENISAEILAKKRGGKKVSKEIPNCMKQHLMVFAPNTDVKTKEYLCDSTACLQLKFE